MGHSAGAQLAALLCIDDHYLQAEGVPFDVFKGCVPGDGDTYDLPAIIMTAELRQTVHGLPLCAKLLVEGGFNVLLSDYQSHGGHG